MELELLADDGNIYEWKGFPWYMWGFGGYDIGVGKELDDWHSASHFNMVGFQMFLYLALCSSLGVVCFNAGKGTLFRILFWGPVLLITLLSLALLVSNLSWIGGAEEIGKELTKFFDLAVGEGFLDVESSFVNNYYPLIISVAVVIFLSVFVFLHREEILHGERVPEGEELEYEPSPWVPSREPFPELPKKHIAASFALLLILAGTFGAFAPGLDMGGSSDGSSSPGSYVPAHDDGDQWDDYANEQSREEIRHFTPVNSIFLINFTLRWRDEDDEPMCTNEGDEFRLTVETPWNETQESEWVRNEHGEEGVIELSFNRDGDPGPTGSDGNFTILVDCGECGDQWYTNPPTVGWSDNGNDYTVSWEFFYWEKI